ncbi:acetyltransferase-like protein [Xylanimonas cellulosilytica DSM 15894]|uniref:Acetyltransferase-like protein n=1 Tax=Xylanimonas cellulosilytica (strain DSM 15894 / JCM 12276 / CECT 5975 / KCTC 9989 / LMG 20990 / NBRC 107835 / XIL07) TaxID=446471 RepID=D1BU40_XYLCX|nr:GNAT family N-acetyltransferase [Xylanimonas cellulosilytica]ACZ29204.1 acetyltransferase-like protein [Xylanimonas cellulosilytica DSM 15894]
MAEVRPHVTVTDDPSGSVVVATLDDGTVAGRAFYDRRGTTVTFTHTEVDPAFGGQGIGSQLAAGALGLVRQAGGTVVPLCPFIRAYMAKHPEHDDLLRTATDFGTRTAGPGTPNAPAHDAAGE